MDDKEGGPKELKEPGMSTAEELVLIFKENFRQDLNTYLEGLESGLTAQFAAEQLFTGELGGWREWDGNSSQVALLAEIVKQELGIDILEPSGDDLVRKDLEVKGVVGQPSEGGGKANVYKTSREGIFLRVVEYKNPELGTRYDFITNPDLEI